MSDELYLRYSTKVLGSKIRYFRELRGMSQDELALKVGYSGRTMISKIELGQRDISADKMRMLADALCVDVMDLIGNDVDVVLEMYQRLTPENQQKILGRMEAYLEGQENRPD